MPYVIVSGNILPSKNSSVPFPWRVGISGLKSFELEDLRRFTLDSQTDAHTVFFKHHPVVLINALEVLGYRVVSSFNVGAESCVWTMRREFPEPEPAPESTDEENDTGGED